MIFIDANILMYASGAAHSNKEPSLELLRGVARGDISGFTDAEVFQEILHRYRAIQRWKEGQRVYQLARQIILDTRPIHIEHVDRANLILDEVRSVSITARDALHVAVYEQEEGALFCSYDRALDKIPWVQRRTPNELIR